MLTKEEWKKICKKYDKWCFYEEVSNLTYKEAENYIKLMPMFIPM